MKYKFVLILMLMGLLTACGTQSTEAPASAPTEASASVISSPVGTEAPAAPTATQVQPTEAPTTDPGAGQTGSISFTNDILPILESRCLNCHGGEKTQEGLSVKTYADLMSGSNNGPVVVSGDPANSLLVKLITTLEMPKKGPKLTPPQIQLITDWVSQGALDN